MKTKRLTDEEFEVQYAIAEGIIARLGLHSSRAGFPIQQGLLIGGNINPRNPNVTYTEVARISWSGEKDLWLAGNLMPGLTSHSWSESILGVATFEVASLIALDRWFGKGPDLVRMGLKR